MMPSNLLYASEVFMGKQQAVLTIMAEIVKNNPET